MAVVFFSLAQHLYISYFHPKVDVVEIHRAGYIGGRGGSISKTSKVESVGGPLSI